MPNSASAQNAQALWIALDAMPVGVSWATVDDQKIVFMNRTFTEMFGYVVGDFTDIPDWTLKYPILDERERAWARWKTYFDHPDEEEFRIEPMELSVICKDGSLKTVIHSGIVLPAAGWALATFFDITERKKNELLLQQAEERASQNEAIYRMLLEHSQEMVVLLALDGSRRGVSPAVLQITGWTPEEFLKVPLHEFVHPSDLPSIDEAGQAVRRGMTACSYRGRIRHKEGEYRWVEVLFQAFNDPATKQPAGYTVTMHDISEQKKQEEMLASLNRKLSEDATHDELTSLPNRRLFNEALAKEMRYQARNRSHIALLMLDIDRFKQYNDTYGHLAGDEILRKVSATLAHSLRRDTDVVARFGGEEFVMLLPLTNCDGAALVANNILHAIRSLNIPHSGSSKGILTLSIGVACWPAGSQADPEELLQQSDVALYRAKESGRDQYAINPCGTEPVPREDKHPS